MIKIGFIDSSGSGLKTITDAVKIDVLDDPFFSGERGGRGDLYGVEQSNKANFNIELDAVSQTEYGNLYDVLNNRLYPHKVYIHEPAAASQRININDAGGNEAKQEKTDDPEGAYATATEFVAGDYTNIQNFTTAVSYNTAAKEYLHYFFQFDLSTWIAAYGTEYLRRLTLFMQDPFVKRTVGSDVDEFGYIVYAYNYTRTSWTEIKRQPVTVGVTNQQFAPLRPIDGFTKFSDYIDGSNYCQFKITNMYDRDSVGTLQHDINYVELIVNGFGFRMVNPFNLNWRSAFTGDGYTGTSECMEL